MKRTSPPTHLIDVHGPRRDAAAIDSPARRGDTEGALE